MGLISVNTGLIVRGWRVLKLPTISLAPGETTVQKIKNRLPPPPPGAIATFGIIGDFGTIDVYIGEIRIGSKGAFCIVKVTLPNFVSEMKTIRTSNPNITFDYKDGILLKLNEEITIELTSLDRAPQVIDISYLWCPT